MFAVVDESECSFLHWESPDCACLRSVIRGSYGQPTMETAGSRLPQVFVARSSKSPEGLPLGFSSLHPPFPFSSRSEPLASAYPAHYILLFIYTHQLSLAMRLRLIFLLCSLAFAECVLSSVYDTTPVYTLLAQEELELPLKPRDLDYRCGPKHGRCTKGTCCSSAGMSHQPSLSMTVSNTARMKRLLWHHEGALPLARLQDRLWPLRCSQISPRSAYH